MHLWEHYSFAFILLSWIMPSTDWVFLPNIFGPQIVSLFLLYMHVGEWCNCHGHISSLFYRLPIKRSLLSGPPFLCVDVDASPWVGAISSYIWWFCESCYSQKWGCLWHEIGNFLYEFMMLKKLSSTFLQVASYMCLGWHNVSGKLVISKK